MSDVDLTGLCHTHSFETATDLCNRCGLEFCEVCVVYPFGAKKPLCKECAMVMGGVRNFVARDAMGTRDVKRRAKSFRHRKQAAAPSLTAPDTPDIVDPVLEDAPEPELEPVAAAAAPTAEAPAAEMAPPPPPGGVADTPADGVAPPIDWNQPFG